MNRVLIPTFYILIITLLIIPSSAQPTHKTQLSDYEIGVIRGDWSLPTKLQLYINGEKFGDQCFLGMTYTTGGCFAISIFQNEKMIEQNQRLIDQNDQIIQLLNDTKYLHMGEVIKQHG